MRIGKITFGIVFLALVVYAGVYFGSNASQTITAFRLKEFSLGNEAMRPAPVKIVLSIAGLLLGLLFGVLHEQIRLSKDRVSISAEFVKAIDSPSFFRALLFSPIVYAGVYAALTTQPDAVISTIFAFQNGFFCENVFRDKQKAPQKLPQS